MKLKNKLKAFFSKLCNKQTVIEDDSTIDVSRYNSRNRSKVLAAALSNPNVATIRFGKDGPTLQKITITYSDRSFRMWGHVDIDDPEK